ncbi:universal stress protein [Candidatus Leptofilum sp.]|uniref:universal stress protein n=1 Tax=Candidatus Leptofilum sp. TaxID=3241576 RepID=UPI003B5B346B
MFQRILVPLDGSDLAERALKPAVLLAEAVQAEIWLLSIPYLSHLFKEDRAGYGLLWPEQSMADTEEALTNYLQLVKARYEKPGLAIQCHLEAGDEASVIVDTAVAQKMDLIVMSTHGRSGFSHWYLGSVTEKVLRSAPCPVLVVRDERPLRHILITLDGSPLSEQALAPGLTVANCCDAAVTLLSVVQAEQLDPKFVSKLENHEAGLGSQARDSFYYRTENYLTQIVQKHQHLTTQELCLVTLSGNPAEQILKAVEAEAVDLVVMATHGRTGLRRWVYGSVTEKVLRRATCNVLMVRPSNFPSQESHSNGNHH